MNCGPVYQRPGGTRRPLDWGGTKTEDEWRETTTTRQFLTHSPSGSTAVTGTLFTRTLLFFLNTELMLQNTVRWSSHNGGNNVLLNCRVPHCQALSGFFCPLTIISKTWVRSIILVSISMISGCSLAPVMNSSKVSSPRTERGMHLDTEHKSDPFIPKIHVWPEI